jgi:pilus assembly protein CpaC
VKANLQRYMFALSLGVRLVLAAANAAAQHYPESPPVVSSVPPSPPGGSAGTSRAATDRGSESGLSGQVVKRPPLTLYRGEVQVLDLPDVTRIAVGNGDVLGAQIVGSSQVVLIGQAAGTTSLRAWTHNGTRFTYEVGVRSLDIA